MIIIIFYRVSITNLLLALNVEFEAASSLLEELLRVLVFRFPKHYGFLFCLPSFRFSTLRLYSYIWETRDGLFVLPLKGY